MPFKDYEYRLAYQRQWVAERRRAYFKDKGCRRCGKTDDLQIHHIDPRRKVTHKVWSWSAERRDIELAKCEILCKQCHTSHHTDLWRKPVVHGTANAYKSHGCRCKDCTRAQRDYQRNWKKRVEQLA